MCMTDYDPPTMHSARIRTARKAHKCGECSRQIEPGEKYQYVSGVWDGDFDTKKTCRHCLVGQELLIRECRGFIYGGIQEDLQDHVSEALPWSMQAARLVVGMRRRWQRFDGKGLMAEPVQP